MYNTLLIRLLLRKIHLLRWRRLFRQPTLCILHSALCTQRAIRESPLQLCTLHSTGDLGIAPTTLHSTLNGRFVNRPYSSALIYYVYLHGGTYTLFRLHPWNYTKARHHNGSQISCRTSLRRPQALPYSPQLSWSRSWKIPAVFSY